MSDTAKAAENEGPRIMVFGAGAVGGYFGGRLAAAGSPVSFVARGRHLRALRQAGLSLISPLGDLRLPKVRASDEPAELGPADVVLLCVKLWDLEDAAKLAVHVLADDGVVIPLQNGVEAETIAAAAIGRARVAGGVAYIGSEIEAPGVIRHVSDFARLVFGELDATASARLKAFLTACERAGIEARLSNDIHRDIWEKFCFLAPFAGATAARRGPIGEVRADPQAWADFQAMVQEAVLVGRAHGVGLSPDLAETIIDFASGLPAAMKSSMLVDLEHGRRLELDWLTGAVVRLGAEHGVDTPVSRRVCEALAPYRNGRQST